MTTESPAIPVRETGRTHHEHGKSDTYREFVRGYFDGDADGALYSQ